MWGVASQGRFRFETYIVFSKQAAPVWGVASHGRFPKNDLFQSRGLRCRALPRRGALFLTNPFSFLDITFRVNVAKPQTPPTNIASRNSSPSSLSSAEMQQNELVRTYVLHAPRAKMTVVNTNSCKLFICCINIYIYMKIYRYMYMCIYTCISVTYL